MSAQVTITQLPSAGALTGTENVPIVQNGVTVQTTTGAIAGAGALNYPFLTTGSTSGLTQARALTAGTGLSLTDGGAGTTLQVNMTGAAAALNAASTGLLVKTGTNTIANVSLSVGSGMTIANADGVAGNPLIGLNTNLQNLSSLSGTGLVTINGSTFSQVTITGASSQISVANGNTAPVIGIASDPVVPGTGGMILPVGTTGQRGSSSNGNLRYNTTTASFEGYANGAWGSILSGSGVSSISFGSTGLTPSTSTTGSVTVAGTLVVANGGTGVTTSTGSGNTVLSTSPTLVTPVLGTPASATLTYATGLPVATGISGLGTGIATFLATPSSANLAAALTDETGTGAAVFATSPTLVTPTLGVATGTSFQGIIGNVTPAAGTFTTITGAILSRVVVIADATSITVNTDTTDIATQANTQAVGTLTINAPTGTAINGQKFILRLTSTNVQTFSFNAIFAGSTDLTLPTVSSGSSKTDYLGWIYDSTAVKWQMIAKVFGF